MSVNTGKRVIDRRRLLAALGTTGGIGALGIPSRSANAQAKEIVFASWGGTGHESLQKAFTNDFTASTGIPVAYDGSGPTNGRIRSMFDSGKAMWDVCDAQGDAGSTMGPLGMLEEIDYNIVDRNKIPPGMAQKYAIPSYRYSHVMVYNKKALGGKVPMTWADFWNTKEFPGKRTLSRYPSAVLEVALMSDGVPVDKVYPLDLGRSIARIRQIKKDVLFWRTGAESFELMRTGEATMGMLWNTRAAILKPASQGVLDFHFNQAVLVQGVWVVPKGNPAGREQAMRLLAYMQDPARQASYLRVGRNGPVNPEANALLTPGERAESPSSPENLATQLLNDVGWWAENRPAAEKAYLEAIS